MTFDSFIANLRTFFVGEGAAWNYNLFGEKSKGCITLDGPSDIVDGGVKQDTRIAPPSGLILDRTLASTETVTELSLTSGTISRVKVNAGTPVMMLNSTQMLSINKDPETEAAVFQQFLTEQDVIAKLRKGVAALIAAQENVGSSVVLDTSGTAMSMQKFLDGSALFGDAYDAIKCFVMHSSVAYKIWGLNLTNAADLFKYEGVITFKDPMGRPIIISDMPALKNGSVYNILGLTAGALYCTANSDVQFAKESENIRVEGGFKRGFRGIWNYEIGLKNFGWNYASGGADPSHAAIATGTNWTAIDADIKRGPGILIKTAV